MSSLHSAPDTAAAPARSRRPARCELRAVSLLLPIAIAVKAFGVHAQPAANAPPAPRGAQRAAADELVIVTVAANGVQRGEFTLLRRADGDFWVLEQDLPRLKLQPADTARRSADGETYYSLAALGGSGLRFNEAQLELQLDFPSQRLEGTRIDLSTRPRVGMVSTAGNSLILSYRLAARHAGGAGGTQLLMDSALAARVQGILLRQDLRIDTHGARHVTRGATQLVWDRQQDATRVIVGDVFSTAGAYGSAITGAGVQLLKLYDLTPDVITQPTASVRTTTALPAEVEVSVDGTRISTSKVGPGPVTVENLALYGGARTVRVTVTDASGRREVIEQLFLFTDSVLAQGLHEYGYFAGRRSDLDADNVLRYKEAAWQGFHRYGLSDRLTIAAGGEGNADFTNAGAGITLRSDRLGLVSLDGLSSFDRELARHARGWSARYTYFTPEWSVVLGRRLFGEGFRTFTTGLATPFPRGETRIGVTTRLWAASLSADWVRTTSAAERRDTLVARLSTNLTRSLSLGGEYQTTRVNGENAWAVNLFVRAALDPERWVGSSARVAPDARQLDVETGKQLPQGEGFGYRVGTSVLRQGDTESALGFASGAWNLRPATVEFLGSAPLHGAGSPFAEVAVSGSVLAVDGAWGLSRRTSDSFVLARLGVPQPGVDIYLNNQRQGTTNADGLLFVPGVGAFGRQDVSLDDKQLPMQFSLARRRFTVTPPFKSGTVVDFGATRVRALAGMAWQVEGGARQPIASHTWTMKGSAGSLAIETAKAGDFYLEHAPPGEYAGSVAVRGKTYTCRMKVPDFAEAVHELREGIVCE